MINCPCGGECACHVGGAFRPACSIAGGCGTVTPKHTPATDPKQRPAATDPKQRRRNSNPKRRGNQPECSCGRPIRDNAYWCHDCSDQLRNLLDQVPSLIDALAVTYMRRARFSDPIGGSRSASTPLPFDARGRRQADALAQTISHWTDRILEHRHIDDAGPTCPRCHHASCKLFRASRPPRNDAISRARWLHANVPWIRHHPLAQNFQSELTLTIRRVLKVIDRKADYWYAGTCRAEYLHIDYAIDPDTGEPAVDLTGTPIIESEAAACCRYELYAKPDAISVDCPRCHTTHLVGERRQWLLKFAEDQLAQPTLIAQALSRLVNQHLTPTRIYVWKHRGRITAKGKITTVDNDGKQHEYDLFRVGDVIDLLNEHAANEARRAAKRARAEELAKAAS